MSKQPLCEHCHQPFTPRRKTQRFCNEPGKNCRQNWHRAQHLPGEIKGIRALKNGGWSITIHQHDRPSLNIGTRVSIETDDKKRLDA